jgi:hypothetical protein
VLIFGYIRAITSADKRLLKALNTGRRDPAEIRRALSQINFRSAKNSNGFISEGCLVSSVLPNGHSALENFGSTPGVPAHMVGSPEVAKLIGTLIGKTLPGKQPSFVQGRGVRGGKGKRVTTAPMNVSEGNTLIVTTQPDAPVIFLTDSSGNTFTQMLGSRWDDIEEEHKFEKDLGAAIGEPRRIAFSFPNCLASILTPDGSAVGSIVIGGVNGELTLRKNELVRTVVNTVTIELNPTFKPEGKPLSMMGTFSVLPTVDGVQPHSWTYTIDAIVDATCSFSVRRDYLAFRAMNYKQKMPSLTGSEELCLAAPRGRPILEVSANAPAAFANIEGRWLLRDISEPTPSEVPKGRMNKATPKVGRNSPCSCGSGKKYKKCCGKES